MADLEIIIIPRTAIIILAHKGNKNTVSFGTKKSNVSPLEYSPPIPAVASIKPTDNKPRLECFTSTSAPNFLLIKTPIAIPVDVMESKTLFANNGSVIPSLGVELIPDIIANGVAIKPPNKAQCATLSLEIGPFLMRQSKNATPDNANIPTVNSVVITWKVLEDIID
tara:strand:- start:1670 stop:2170 length:501 start_codon:yes stop_codon:yes gene_type:complete